MGSTPLRGVSNPTCLKTPPCGVNRASCPSRAGGTTFSSPPHSVGCPTQHASTRPCPLGRGPPRLLPIAGGGDHILSPPHSVGCLTQHASINKTLPLRAGSTAPPAHRGRGDHILFSTPLRGVSNPTAPINKTPNSGVHRASCPSRAGGPHSLHPT